MTSGFALSDISVPPGVAVRCLSVERLVQIGRFTIWTSQPPGSHAWTLQHCGRREPRRSVIFATNAVAAGVVWSSFDPSCDNEVEDVSKFGALVPMKRPAQPEEIAPVYVLVRLQTSSGTSPVRYCRSSAVTGMK